MGIKRKSLSGGEVFGRRTVIKYSHSSKRKDGRHGERVMICKCQCGALTEVRTSNLYSGNTQSCGCLHSEKTSDSNLSRGNKT